MPETKEVRVLAALVGKRTGLTPWWEHRDAVLPEVYRSLGLGPYRAKRKRVVAAAATVGPECAVCLEQCDNLVLLVPCGHRKVCSQCASRCNGRCPICRRPFTEQVERIYE